MPTSSRATLHICTLFMLNLCSCFTKLSLLVCLQTFSFRATLHSSFFEFATGFGGSTSGFIPGDWNWNFGSERRTIVDVDFVQVMDSCDSLLGFWFLFLIRSVCGAEEKDHGRWFSVSSTAVALFRGISADWWCGYWDFVIVDNWLAMPWPMGPFGFGSWWIWLFFL